jgi:hypothetical protein
MTKSRELAALRRLERLASNPTPFAKRATLSVVAIVVLGGPFLSVSDHLLQRNHFELLKWIYLGVGAILAIGAHMLAAAFNARRNCKYIDVAAVRQRIEVLEGERGADV